MSKYRGRIPIVDQFHPESWGRDDITGLPVMHQDMVKQMEYIGNGLSWTGLMVHYKDADEPNPQLIPPIIPPDPIPIANPRILQLLELPPIPSGLAAITITNTTIELTWNPVVIAQSYVLVWSSQYTGNEVDAIALPTYTITNLSPGNTYAIAVATVCNYPRRVINVLTPQEAIGQSAFCNPIVVTTLP